MLCEEFSPYILTTIIRENRPAHFKLTQGAATPAWLDPCPLIKPSPRLPAPLCARARSACGPSVHRGPREHAGPAGSCPPGSAAPAGLVSAAGSLAATDVRHTRDHTLRAPRVPALRESARS